MACGFDSHLRHQIMKFESICISCGSDSVKELRSEDELFIYCLVCNNIHRGEKCEFCGNVYQIGFIKWNSIQFEDEITPICIICSTEISNSKSSLC